MEFMAILKRLSTLSVFFLLAAGCGDSARTTLIPQGTWGDIAAELNVSADGASLSLCCASGTINAPLTVSSTGSFTLTGTYLRQGGPIPVGGFQSEAATYSGVINGNRMNLTITTPGSGPQTMTLTLGTFKTAMCICAL
jgi:hypothetical protein